MSQAREATVVRIHGRCDDRFSAARTAFEANFRERDELGAAVTVLIGGEPVADLWGGWADAARTRPWERDTRGPSVTTARAAPAASPTRRPISPWAT